jgi:hypothetical protein
MTEMRSFDDAMFDKYVFATDMASQ